MLFFLGMLKIFVKNYLANSTDSCQMLCSTASRTLHMNKVNSAFQGSDFGMLGINQLFILFVLLFHCSMLGRNYCLACVFSMASYRRGGSLDLLDGTFHMNSMKLIFGSVWDNSACSSMTMMWVNLLLTLTMLCCGQIKQMTTWSYFSYCSWKIGFDIPCKLSQETIYMKCQKLFPRKK